MQRVYAVVREEIVHLVDDRAKVMGVTRSLWIGKAIESYLHLQDRTTSVSRSYVKTPTAGHRSYGQSWPRAQWVALVA